jgi:hypothetical protein
LSVDTCAGPIPPRSIPEHPLEEDLCMPFRRTTSGSPAGRCVRKVPPASVAASSGSLRTRSRHP